MAQKKLSEEKFYELLLEDKIVFDCKETKEG
mgnify:CR=1 FL=1